MWKSEKLRVLLLKGEVILEMIERDVVADADLRDVVVIEHWMAEMLLPGHASIGSLQGEQKTSNCEMA